MIRDYMDYRPPPEVLAKMELIRLPADRRGFRLDITAPRIRAALDEWKREQHIPIGDPLSDGERKDFELWYMITRRERGF